MQESQSVSASPRPATVRSEWLDVVRGLAIATVVAVHSIQVADRLVVHSQSKLFSDFIGNGKYGVELFFFISGWLLVSIYGQSGDSLGKSYWARRIGRIYPLWLVFLGIQLFRAQATQTGGLYTAMQPLDGEPQFFHSTAGIIVLALTFTLFISASLWNNVIPGGWSIQSEVGHYLLFPLIRNRSLNVVLVSAALVNIVTRYLRDSRPYLNAWPNGSLHVLDAWLRLGLYSTFGYFLIGILSFLIYQGWLNTRSIQASFKSAGISWPVWALFIPSLFIVSCPLGRQNQAYAFLIVMILVSFAIMKFTTSRRIFTVLGKYSYFIYFMHFRVLDSMERIATNIGFVGTGPGSQELTFVAVLVLALGTSILFAIPSMKYFERPIIRFSHRVK